MRQHVRYPFICITVEMQIYICIALRTRRHAGALVRFHARIGVYYSESSQGALRVLTRVRIVLQLVQAASRGSARTRRSAPTCSRPSCGGCRARAACAPRWRRRATRRAPARSRPSSSWRCMHAEPRFVPIAYPSSTRFSRRAAGGACMWCRLARVPREYPLCPVIVPRKYPRSTPRVPVR